MTGDMLVGAGISNMSDAYVNEWVTTLDNLKKIDFDTVLPGQNAKNRRFDSHRTHLSH